MYPIKTVSHLLRCLKANVAVYKTVCTIELRVTPVEIYKMSLIEILANQRDSLFYTYASKQIIDNLLLEQEKEATAEEELKKNEAATEEAKLSAGEC